MERQSPTKQSLFEQGFKSFEEHCTSIRQQQVKAFSGEENEKQDWCNKFGKLIASAFVQLCLPVQELSNINEEEIKDYYKAISKACLFVAKKFNELKTIKKQDYNFYDELITQTIKEQASSIQYFYPLFPIGTNYLSDYVAIDDEIRNIPLELNLVLNEDINLVKINKNLQKVASLSPTEQLDVLMKEAKDYFKQFEALKEIYFKNALDKKWQVKENRARIGHKIEQNNEEGRVPGCAYIYDILRASCRYDDKIQMVESIKEILKNFKIVKLQNKLLGELRNVTICLVVENFIAEIQVIYSPEPSTSNSFMNHNLYEIKRCSNLKALSQALQGISLKSINESVPIQQSKISQSQGYMDTLFQKHLKMLEGKELIFLSKLCEQANKFEDMAYLMVNGVKSKRLTVQDPEVRDLLSVALKELIGADRGSIVKLQKIYHLQNQQTYTVIFQQYLNIQADQLVQKCKSTIHNIKETCFPIADESKNEIEIVFFKKLIADYYRYQCEAMQISNDEKRKSALKKETQEIFNDAFCNSLPPEHPVILGLNLSHSVFICLIEEDKQKAIGILKRSIDMQEKIGSFASAERKEANEILDTMRRNLEIWLGKEELEGVDMALLEEIFE